MRHRLNPSGIRRLGLLVLLALLPGAVGEAGFGQAAAESPLEAATPQPASPEEPTPEPSAPQAIALPEVATQADETTRQLREIRKAAAPAAQVGTIESELEARRSRIQEGLARTEELLAEEASLDRLQDVQQAWLASAGELASWRTTLTKRAIALEKRVEELAGFRERWRKTLAKARSEDAPQGLVTRIQGVLEELEKTEQALNERRNQVLALQNRVAEEEVAVGDVLAELDQELARRRGALLRRDRPALWTALASAERRDLLPELEQGLRSDLRRSRAFFGRRTEALALQGLLLVAALGMLLHLRRRAQSWEPDDPRRSCAAVWERPISTALVLGLLSHSWFHPHSPAVIRDLSGLVVLAPLVRLLPRLLPFAPRPVLIALAAFYLTDQIRTLMDTAALGERLIFLLETGAATAVLGGMLRPGRLAHLPRDVQMPAVVPYLMRLGAALMLIAVVANVAGFYGLAKLLGQGVLRSAYAAVLLAGGLYIVRDLARLLLGSRLASGLHMVRRHRALLQRRTLRLLDLGFLAAWTLFVLEQFTLRQSVADGLRGLLGASLAVGAISLSLGDLVVFAVTVAASIWIARALTFLLDEDVFPRLSLQRGVPNAISSSARYAILLGGFFLAVAAAGVDFQRFTFLAGALGVGIGFGLQNVVNNFVSGLILLYERPIQVGDAIELTELFGEVRRIGIRSSTVRTWDGSEVIVPNGDLISARVTNWTLSDRQRRMNLKVGVAYGTDPARVLEILLRVAREHPDVLDAPPPFARFVGFGDSSLDFELWAFVGRFEIFWPIANEVLLRIHAELRDAGIPIPFPQRDLHLRSADPEAFRLLAGDAKGDRQTTRRPREADEAPPGAPTRPVAPGATASGRSAAAPHPRPREESS